MTYIVMFMHYVTETLGDVRPHETPAVRLSSASGRARLDDATYGKSRVRLLRPDRSTCAPPAVQSDIVT